MVLCPVAIAVGCKKCPAFNLCPAKTIIGDARKDEADQALRAKKGSAPVAKSRK